MKIGSLLQQRWARVVFMLLALVLASHPVSAGPALDRIVETGVLRVAMSGDQQPFNFSYGKQKSLVGFDVDLAKELARFMKVELKLMTVPFNDLMGVIEDGSADMVISGMTITSARTRNVSFVGPYVLSGKSLLASSKAAGKLKKPGDFNDSQITLVALQGSTSESLVMETLPKARFKPVASYEAGVKLLMEGEVDGMVADMPILAYTRNQNRDSKLQLITPPLSIEPIGVVITKDDPQFENLVRNYMTMFEKTGLLLNLYNSWFERGRGELYRP